MAQSKIKIGQCYRKFDIVYMVIAEPEPSIDSTCIPRWLVQDTLNKGVRYLKEEWFDGAERPFPNWG